ncbi:PAS domain-containing protein [Halobacterium yunchengense]|uniref:PAS domain-containing protein n=1 Tax=Halobacterium yunchengense TaxID=3108497 RepID=UPI0030093AA6
MTERGAGTPREESASAAAPGGAFDALAAATDGAVVRFDADGRVAGVDDEFRERTGLSAADATGDPGALFDSQSAARVRRLVAAGDAASAVVRLADGGGAGAFELAVQPTDDGGAVGVLRPTDRPTGAAERERVLREFHEATVDRDRPLEDRVANVLGVVRDALGTEYAALSSVDDEAYRYEVVDADPAGDVDAGDSLALSQTNCERVVETEETVVLRDLQADAPELAAREANADHGLSCFLGAPVYVNGDLFGTLCVFGTAPAEGRFSEWGTTLVDVAARWVGAALSRRRTRERLERRNEELADKERRYRTLVEQFPNGAVALVDDDLRYRTVGGTPQTGPPADPAALEGTRVEDLPDDEFAAAVEPRYRAALDGERSHFEYEADDRVVDVRTFPVRDDDGNVVAAMGMSQDVTEQRARERRLRQYEAVVETMQDGVYVVDDDGYYDTVNDGFASLTGYDREELLGAHATLVVEEAALERAADLRERAPADGTPRTMETTVETADGREVPVEVAFSSLETPDGDDLRVGVVRDVTERLESQRRLRESEQRYRTLVENFPNGGVGVFDGDLRYTLVDGTMWSDLDVDAADLEGDTVREALPTDTAADVEPVFRAALHGETDSVVAELEGRTYRVWATPLRNADGEVTAGQSFALDVTEQHDRRRTLERRARQQAVVAELGRTALETEDLDDLMREAAARVADVLDAEYCKVLDLDDEARELRVRQGVGWDDGVVGDATVDAEENSQAGYTLLSEAPVVVEDLAAETRFDGPDLLTSHGVTSGVSTIVGSVDDPWGILGVHDTGERSFGEEDVNFVQSVANVLAAAVERHRHDREREQLVAELEASNERLEQFAYAASHDLQEPLRMVSSYLSLVERRYGDELDADGREFVEYAVDGADRMQEMIRALLEYSRVETRGGDFEPVDLEAVFADVRRDFEVRIAETDATIHAGPLPTVRGDADQLRQVLANLLGNALEYSGDDPPEVWVSAERDGDEWVVSVRDDGVGIDPEHADRVFEVFERLHTHEEHPGTGIGLALVERIVERHGGDVWVASEPGEGATFSFTVPDGGVADE